MQMSLEAQGTRTPASPAGLGRVYRASHICLEGWGQSTISKGLRGTKSRGSRQKMQEQETQRQGWWTEVRGNRAGKTAGASMGGSYPELRIPVGREVPLRVSEHRCNPVRAVFQIHPSCSGDVSGPSCSGDVT